MQGSYQRVLHRKGVWDVGFRIADWGLGIALADWGLPIADWGLVIMVVLVAQ